MSGINESNEIQAGCKGDNKLFFKTKLITRIHLEGGGCCGEIHEVTKKQKPSSKRNLE